MGFGRGYVEWLVVCAFVFGGIVCGVVAYPLVAPEDGSGLLRSLILRVGTMLVGFLFLSLALFAFDELTPGRWFNSIAGNPIAEAAVVCSLAFSLALIFIYS